MSETRLLFRRPRELSRLAARAIRASQTPEMEILCFSNSRFLLVVFLLGTYSALLLCGWLLFHDHTNDGKHYSANEFERACMTSVWAETEGRCRNRARV